MRRTLHTRRRFTNWAGNQTARPARWLVPRSEEALREHLREARRQGHPVRVVGAGHSWSPLVPTAGWLLDPGRLCSLVAVDRERGTVTVQAGMRLKALNELLAREGLALPNLGSISEQSVAGALATGTHGTGVTYPILSMGLVGARVVLADGSTLTVTEEQNAYLLPALRVHLGLLGVVTEVTLKVVPAFRLEETADPLRFEDAAADLDALARSAPHVKLWWLPHTDTVQVFRLRPTETSPSPLARLDRLVQDRLVSRVGFETLLWTGEHIPPLVPTFNSLVARTWFSHQRRVDRSDRVFNTVRPPVHYEAEYAVDIRRAGAALTAMREAIEGGGHRVNFIVEVRFVAEDDCWLSPAQGRESCYLGAYYRGRSGWRAYQQAIEGALHDYGARPHWGKTHTASRETLAERYPKFRDFLRLRRELDPQGRFLSASLHPLFR